RDSRLDRRRPDRTRGEEKTSRPRWKPRHAPTATGLLTPGPQNTDPTIFTDGDEIVNRGWRLLRLPSALVFFHVDRRGGHLVFDRHLLADLQFAVHFGLGVAADFPP